MLLDHIEIAAYYQCYKNTPAVENALKNFRSHYPKSDLYLLSDSGDHFDELARNYNCIYERSDKNLSISNFTFETGLEFVYRFNRVLQNIKEEVVILLEDDVFIKTRLHGSFLCDFAGPIVGNCIEEPMSKVFAKFGMRYPANWQYGFCGGSIIKKQSWLASFPYIETILVPFLKEAFDNVGQIQCADYLLSMVMFLMNKKYERLGCFGEFLRNPSIIHQPNIAVIHQIKDWSVIK